MFLVMAAFGRFSWMLAILVVILISQGGLGLGLFSKRVGEATVSVAAVGALLLGFQVKLGLVRGKYLLAGLHAAEASHVSSSSISAFRAAIVRAVWSAKMPLANVPAIFNVLDGFVGIDPAFHIFWARFRMMHGY